MVSEDLEVAHISLDFKIALMQARTAKKWNQKELAMVLTNFKNSYFIEN